MEFQFPEITAISCWINVQKHHICVPLGSSSSVSSEAFHEASLQGSDLQLQTCFRRPSPGTAVLSVVIVSAVNTDKIFQTIRYASEKDWPDVQRCEDREGLNSALILSLISETIWTCAALSPLLNLYNKLHRQLKAGYLEGGGEAVVCSLVPLSFF